MSIRRITITEFHAALTAQHQPNRQNLAFVCPMCGTVQSMKSWIAAGKTPEYAEGQIGFSCIGRALGAGAPRKEKDGMPCNWSLGGLFKCHELEVVTPDGEVQPSFVIATAEQAAALAAVDGVIQKEAA